MDKDEDIGGEEGSVEGTQSNLPPRALMGVFTPPESLAAATDMRHLADMLDNVSLRGDQRAEGRQKVRSVGFSHLLRSESGFSVSDFERRGRAIAGRGSRRRTQKSR